MTTEPSTTPQPSSTKLWLGRPWWQGVAAILAVIGILVSVLVACISEADQAPQGPKINTGICNEVTVGGDDNSVICIPDASAEDQGGQPPKVTATLDESMCHGEWISPLQAEEIANMMAADPHLDRTLGWNSSKHSVGGMPASPGHAVLMVEGHSDRQIVLTDIKVRVKERKPVTASGTKLDVPCGDDGAYRWLQVDLDKDPPATIARHRNPQAVADELPEWAKKPIRFPYTVSRDDAEMFLISTYTDNCECGWEVELSWMSGGRTGVETIRNGQQLFWTSAIGQKRKCDIDYALFVCDPSLFGSMS